MAGKADRTKRAETFRLLILLFVSILIAEAAIMFVSDPHYPEHPILAAFVVSALLTLALFPVLHFTVFKRLIPKKVAMATAQAELSAAYDELERQVEERTRETEKAKRDLEISQERFADIAESAGDWIWEMDENLRFSYISPRFFELFGVAPGELIGKTREEFAGVKTYDEQWRQHLDDLANHRPFQGFAYATTQSDGRPGHILIRGKPVFDADGVFKGYWGTGADKTAEVEARRALEESEKQFRNLIEGSIQGVFIHENGNILFANQALADIVGYASPEEIVALKRVEPLIAPAERERLAGYRSARKNGEFAPEIYEARGLKKDGSEIWLEYRVTKVDWYGIAALQCVVIDITERKAAEEALQQQNERFNAALENMSQGLCMFDSEQRLVVCNERYASMYGLSADEVKPGIHFRRILEHRIASGIYAGDAPEDYIQERCAAVLERKSSSKIQELTDGRVVAIAHQPLADGGWLATHEDITDYRRIEERLAYLAHHDALTDLPNRILLRERLEESLERAREGAEFALLYLDLDGFKDINDTLGHLAGDALLKVVAERLCGCVTDTDLVARLGGDEFAIIRAANVRAGDAEALAECICEAIRAPVGLGHHEAVVGISIGIAIAPQDGAGADRLLRNADLALHHAKSARRGGYRAFEPEMEANTRDRHTMGLDLRKALARDEFELYYQPVFNLERNKIGSFEALLRWHRPGHGMVSPADFIPVAEEIGLINELGEWVLQTACAEAAGWPDDVNIAVNVSPVQFMRGNLMEVVRNALSASGLSPRRLELEITESVLLKDDQATLAMLHQLQELGARISMDDFGTGYSSLSYLRSFPFDKIKIDASFVSDLSAGVDDIGIVHAVVSLASRLGVATTAEGVETEEQLEIVKAEGCTEAQGYLFSPPMSARDILHLLPRRKKKMESAA